MIVLARSQLALQSTRLSVSLECGEHIVKVSDVTDAIVDPRVERLAASAAVTRLLTQHTAYARHVARASEARKFLVDPRVHAIVG